MNRIPPPSPNKKEKLKMAIDTPMQAMKKIYDSKDKLVSSIVGAVFDGADNAANELVLAVINLFHCLHRGVDCHFQLLLLVRTWGRDSVHLHPRCQWWN